MHWISVLLVVWLVVWLGVTGGSFPLTQYVLHVWPCILCIHTVYNTCMVIILPCTTCLVIEVVKTHGKVRLQPMTMLYSHTQFHSNESGTEAIAISPPAVQFLPAISIMSLDYNIQGYFLPHYSFPALSISIYQYVSVCYCSLCIIIVMQEWVRQWWQQLLQCHWLFYCS